MKVKVEFQRAAGRKGMKFFNSSHSWLPGVTEYEALLRSVTPLTNIEVPNEENEYFVAVSMIRVIGSSSLTQRTRAHMYDVRLNDG